MKSKGLKDLAGKILDAGLLKILDSPSVISVVVLADVSTHEVALLSLMPPELQKNLLMLALKKYMGGEMRTELIDFEETLSKDGLPSGWESTKDGSN